MRFFLLFSLLSFTLSSHSQNFYGSVVAGTNISQIDGDFVAGFDRYNLSGGVRVDYPVTPSADVSIELLYSGRGSKSSFDKVNVRLDYIEIPLIFSLRDWYVEKDKYDKVRAEVGLSYGYLFRSDLGQKFASYDSDLKNDDVSFLLGAGYMFTKNVGIGVRYTRGLSRILKSEKLESGGFLSYFTTVRAEYHF